jgi:hypothetical protein
LEEIAEKYHVLPDRIWDSHSCVFDEIVRSVLIPQTSETDKKFRMGKQNKDYVTGLLNSGKATFVTNLAYQNNWFVCWMET